MKGKITPKKSKKNIGVLGSMDNPIKSPMSDFLKKLSDLKNDFGTSVQFGKSIKKNKFNRVIGTVKETEKDGSTFTSTVNVNEEYLTPVIKFNNEAIPFLFHINGCAKNFLLFISAYLLDGETGIYKVNAHIYKLFMEYAFDIFGESYKLDTIKQCHRELVEKNMVCNVSTGIYKINPLIVSLGGDTKKRQLFKDYTELLISKGKDSVKDFYPHFKK
jgi:hypothetical protein